jgi:hypothetical protein
VELLYLDRKKFGTTLGTSPTLTDCVLKHEEHWVRSGLTDVDRMSGSPQPSAAPAPPESNADIEPTAAKASAQAFV